MNRLKTAFEFSRNKLCASILTLALLFVATLPHATRCWAGESAKHTTLGKVAQEWMQVGIEQHNRSLFKAAEQSFRRATEYGEYLSAAKRKKLDKWSEKARIAAAKSVQPASKSTPRSLENKIRSLTDRLPPKIAPVKGKLPADSVKNGRDLTKKELEFVAAWPVTVDNPLRENRTIRIKPARSSSTHCVLVGGQVSKPAVVPMPGKMTATEAIVKVGGVDLRAAERKNVIVIRYTDGQRYAYKLDLAGSKTKPFYLQPRDIVHVPRARIAKLNQWIDKNIDKLIGNAGIFVGTTSGDAAVLAGAHR